MADSDVPAAGVLVETLHLHQLGIADLEVRIYPDAPPPVSAAKSEDGSVSETPPDLRTITLRIVL